MFVKLIKILYNQKKIVYEFECILWAASKFYPPLMRVRQVISVKLTANVSIDFVRLVSADSLYIHY